MEFDEDSIRLRVPVSQGDHSLGSHGPFSGFDVIFFETRDVSAGERERERKRERERQRDRETDRDRNSIPTVIRQLH